MVQCEFLVTFLLIMQCKICLNNFIQNNRMKKVLFFYCLLATFAANSQKAVFIIADGIPADVLEKVSIPNINKISSIGSFVRSHVGGEKDGYSATPTISAVSYNSLLTGTWANKHNVWGNDIKAPNYNYPTIFRLFKNQYPNKKIAIYSTWIDNRKKLIGDSLAATQYLTMDIKYDGYEIDKVKFPHDSLSNYIHLIDDQVIFDAANSIKNDAPDLSWIYLEFTDDMGHKFGDSQQQLDAIKLLDKQVGKVWEAIEYRQKKYKENWMIIITTDHGRSEDNGKNHGGQTPRQRSTWISSNKTFNSYSLLGNVSIVDILPTIARHLQIQIPDSISNEIDGIPLIGKVSILQPYVNVFQKTADITWKTIDTTGTAKIYISRTNNVAKGGMDKYLLKKEVPVKMGYATLDITEIPSDFYKIVIEAKYNKLNYWWIKNKNSKN